MTKALVTGAGGFVGRHLVTALMERGDDVITADVAEMAAQEGVRSLRFDICDAEAVAEACGGVDVVFHAASVVHTRTTNRDLVFAINEGGTRHVLDACRVHGVARLVYVSSASVVYEGRDIEHGDEGMPYASVSQAPYADSKISAEKLVLAANTDELRCCAVRPHVVFGPGDTRFLPAVLRRARAGQLKYRVGGGRELSDFTYIDNLVDALLLADAALCRGDAGGEAYFVTNGEPTPFFDFVGRVLAALDLPPIRGAAPYWIAYSAAAVAEAVAAIRGKPVGQEDGMTRFAIRYLCTHHYFSIDKARRELGYQPRVSIDEGIALTCRAILAQPPFSTMSS